MLDGSDGDLPYAMVSALAWVFPAITLAVFLCAVVGGYLVAFRSRRPGGYWMLAGAALFVAQFLYYVTFWRYTAGPALDFSMTRTMYRDALAPAIPLLPVLLFAIGFLRLAWSLRNDRVDS